jgi:hypothetical protein
LDRYAVGVSGRQSVLAVPQGLAGRADHCKQMRARRCLVLLLAPLALAGCGDAGVRVAAPVVAARPPATPTPAPAPLTPVLIGDQAPKAPTFASVAAAEVAAAARLRREQIAAARRVPTVPGALRVARLTGRISAAAEARSDRDWAAAQAAVTRLFGVRRNELASVVGTLNGLAAAHELTADRLDPAFLILRVNTSFWTRAPLPAAGFRTSFGSNPAIFQYYPGDGLQLQPLASWGRANALANACLTALRAHSRRHPCRTAALTRSLDRLSGLGAQRDGYTAWEYYFSYGTGAPPWVSGMTQATAVQALARGYRALGVTRWRRTALRALGAFEQPPPAGVAVPAPGGSQYLLYSFAPGYRVLNGDLQAVIGLRDLAALTHSATAARLFRAGDAAARRVVAGFDTGAWSLYSARGAESTLSYHKLLAGFLDGLCKRLDASIYCRTGERFHRYERQPTKIGLTPLKGLRADRSTEIRFTLSKISTVNVRLSGARGVSLARTLQLPRGSHALVWRPPGRGRYHLRIEARGPSGPAGVARETIRIVKPKPKPRRRRRDHGRKVRDRGTAAASRRQP